MNSIVNASRLRPCCETDFKAGTFDNVVATNLGDLKLSRAVKTLLEMMSGALTQGERIEIRGFGSFSLHFRPPRLGRNPKTGDSVALPGKYVPHFKPGKELRDRVNAGAVAATAATE